METEHFPPPGPPPLLDQDELVTLASQGYLPVELSEAFQSDLKALFDALESFHEHSPKDKAALYPAKQGTEFGYYRVEGEKEYVTLRCSSAGRGDAGMEALAAKVWEQAGSLLHRILCDIARATDLPPSVWDEMLDGTLTLPTHEKDVTGTLLRLFKYFPDQGIAGEHTDLGLLTLCVGTRPGLQCLPRDEDEPEWSNITGPVVLVGQTLRALSKGIILPGIHRVVSNPEGRFSIVFALRHTFKHSIDLRRFGGDDVVDPRKLWEMLKIGVVNVNARKDLRSMQRKHLDEQRLRELAGQG
jgi:hypothetical protein